MDKVIVNIYEERFLRSMLYLNSKSEYIQKNGKILHIYDEKDFEINSIVCDTSVYFKNLRQNRKYNIKEILE